MNPTFIYGTAWKTERTTDLVTQAIEVGYRAIDTANQPKHYSEPLVGLALQKVFSKEGGLKRKDFWIQTKFTPVDGHDERIPYNVNDKITDQVKQSFASSLEHLGVDFIDSYLLHGPYNQPGLGGEDWEAWGALEKLSESGDVGQIGISNVNAGQLAELIEKARIKPQAVQNRCYGHRTWDKEVRELCLEHGIQYQGFSLLTANRDLVEHPAIVKQAELLTMTAQQMIFRFSIDIGMVPLTGTTDTTHMAEDLMVLMMKSLDAELRERLELAYQTP